ncbi:hypothetical protein HYV86_02420 [Candidatus Woesearchaeota archaeon]|nr:hypothetical protein [Candidatus Woesearchaeota archaeon]
MRERLEQVCQEVMAIGLFEGEYSIDGRTIRTNPTHDLPWNNQCHAAVAVLEQRLVGVPFQVVGFHIEGNVNGKPTNSTHVVGVVPDQNGVYVLDPTLGQYGARLHHGVYTLNQYPLVKPLLERLSEHPI